MEKDVLVWKSDDPKRIPFNDPELKKFCQGLAEWAKTAPTKRMLLFLFETEE